MPRTGVPRPRTAHQRGRTKAGPRQPRTDYRREGGSLLVPRVPLGVASARPSDSPGQGPAPRRQGRPRGPLMSGADVTGEALVAGSEEPLVRVGGAARRREGRTRRTTTPSQTWPISIPAVPAARHAADPRPSRVPGPRLRTCDALPGSSPPSPLVCRNPDAFTLRCCPAAF
jgi:hypothetical protein